MTNNETDLIDWEWRHSLSAPLTEFLNYSESVFFANAKTKDGFHLTMGFYCPRGDRYGVLYLSKFRNDDMSHYTAYDEGRVRTPQEAAALIEKWAKKYGFECPFEKQGRLF
jgi:hypothetical protein